MSAAVATQRVALVAGGGGVIGRAIVERLAIQGVRVVSADLREPADVQADVDTRLADLADPVQIGRAVEGVVADYGRLDWLVCAAGIASLGSFEQITLEEWERVHAINVRGVFLLMQAAIAPMRAAGYGRIVTIGSVLGKNGGNPRPWLDPAEQAGASNAAYGAAKAGVHALTLYLAKELASSGITVNCVAPGPIASPMTSKFPAALASQIPVGRLGKASEVSAAVAWLCADDSAYVTGEILDINGGLWMD